MKVAFCEYFFYLYFTNVFIHYLKIKCRIRYGYALCVIRCNYCYGGSARDGCSGGADGVGVGDGHVYTNNTRSEMIKDLSEWNGRKSENQGSGVS